MKKKKRKNKNNESMSAEDIAAELEEQEEVYGTEKFENPESETVFDDAIEMIRQETQDAIAELESSGYYSDTEEYSEQYETDGEYTEQYETAEEYAEQYGTAEEYAEQYYSPERETAVPAQSQTAEVKQQKSLLRQILDEDPSEIISERSEKTESGGSSASKKRNVYAFFGLIFAVLACFGAVTAFSKGAEYFTSFTSGETKKDGFAEIIYPAVIMDIEPFEDVSELSSEQIVTAALWSMIMTDNALDKYSRTFDVVSVPAADVEAAAVKLFGTNLPEIQHTTVGPSSARFYYNESVKSYNVPVSPVVFTYEPEIVSVSRNDNIYTLVVDYINELPAWMNKTSSKTAEYTLTGTNEGYQISSVKILTQNDSL